MRYALLIYTAEPTEPVPDDVQKAEMAGYTAFTREIRERGQYEAGEALQPTSTATTVRVRNGQTLLTDGPYVETKEALGGFYLIDARDLDEATEVAARIPGARHGAIEVRPLLDMAAYPEAAETAGATAG